MWRERRCKFHRPDPLTDISRSPKRLNISILSSIRRTLARFVYNHTTGRLRVSIFILKKKRKNASKYTIWYRNVYKSVREHVPSVRIINMPPLSTGRFFPLSAALLLRLNTTSIIHYNSSWILVFSLFCTQVF